MAALDSNSSNFNEEGDLRLLLETYGSHLSLEAIAYAYCQAKRNVSDACTILFEMYKNMLKNYDFSSNDHLEETQSIGTLHTSQENNVKTVKSTRAVYRAINPKKGSISAGTVSSVLGKEYINSKPSRNEPCKTMRPLRFVTAPSVSVVQSEELLGNTKEDDTTKKDIDKFLVNMLGDGFKLDTNAVHDVLGICGHDVNKHELRQQQLESCHTDLKNFKISSSVGAAEVNSNCEGDDEYCLPGEIVEAIFKFPERKKESKKVLPKRKIIRPRPRVFGKPVTGPFFDAPEVNPIFDKEKEDFQNEDRNADGDEEDSYDILRKNVKEYWETMKEYTKSAVEAFVSGDHTRASELMKEGNMCRKMARETEEQSAQKITESGAYNMNSVISLDLKGQAPKDIIRLLKSHLTSLSGIPSIEYLKVMCGRDDDGEGEKKKNKRSHRQLVVKMLERECIGWSEEEEGVILVNVGDIDPDCLTFNRKDT